MPSKEEVLWAYRMLLDREPKSEAVLNHYATNVPSRSALRALFMQSAEFRNTVQGMTAVRQPLVRSGPPMEVELDAPADRLAALFARVSAQWHYLGETEPHWSVITNQSYLQTGIADSAEAFYESGRTELAAFEQALARVGLAGQGFEVCVELGCGVGRVTSALAQRCAQVWGVDISAHHLKLAADYAREQGLNNVQWHQVRQVDDVVPVAGFDLLYSRIVLQHNPPPVMQRMLGLLLHALNPGGVAYFQVPTYKAGYRFELSAYLEGDNTTSMEMHYLPQPALFALLAQHGCVLLELREDDAAGLSPNAVSNTVLVRKRA